MGKSNLELARVPATFLRVQGKDRARQADKTPITFTLASSTPVHRHAAAKACGLTFLQRVPYTEYENQARRSGRCPLGSGIDMHLTG